MFELHLVTIQLPTKFVQTWLVPVQQRGRQHQQKAQDLEVWYDFQDIAVAIGGTLSHFYSIACRMKSLQDWNNFKKSALFFI